MYKYDLGIIGGMGSEATVEIYKRIIERTVHSCDQEHMKICILNNSIIPDRTKCILENAENPLPYINESIKDLEDLNVEYFIIPCNTAHYFADEFEIKNIKFISMIDETLSLIKNQYQNYKVCVLGTTGTIKTKVYHNHSSANNINFVYANDYEQNKIMNVITSTKADVDREITKKELLSIITDINMREGNCLFVLACTELSLYLKYIEKQYLVIDAMDCLINSSITKCGYKLK